MIWLSIVLLLLALGLLAAGGGALKRKRLLENIPTSKVAGLSLGQSEVKGAAEKRRPLVSYLAGVRCVYYTYTIQEKWERTVTETYTDSDGKTRTRTRTESGWTTVAGSESAPPFMLRDDTGAVRVVPDGATIHAHRVFSETCGPYDALYYGKGPEGSIPDSAHRRSFTERAIPAEADLYVLGTVRLRKDGLTPEIGRSPTKELYLISVKGEEALQRSYGYTSFFLLLAGLLLALAGAAFLEPRELYATTGDWLFQNPGRLILAGGIYAGLVALWYGFLLYNGLVYVRNRVESSASQIDIQLRRRAVLIPRLASVVKAFADHEADVFRTVAALRAPEVKAGHGLETAGADREAAAQAGVVKQLIAMGEAYPELRSDQHFLALQKRMTRTEDRIALARGFYNESVTIYNDRIATFPDVVVAKLTGFKPMDLFRD
jgi:hypothetical protein